MSKTEYVLSFAAQVPTDKTQSVIVIERAKKDWQLGRLNLPGGRIEPGEEPERAAFRELREETGIEASIADIKVLGVMEGADWVVHVCLCPYHNWHGRQPELKGESDQPAHQLPWSQLKNDTRLIPNLTLIIPLCQARLTGWKLTPTSEDERGWNIHLGAA